LCDGTAALQQLCALCAAIRAPCGLQQAARGGACLRAGRAPRPDAHPDSPGVHCRGAVRARHAAAGRSSGCAACRCSPCARHAVACRFAYAPCQHGHEVPVLVPAVMLFEGSPCCERRAGVRTSVCSVKSWIDHSWVLHDVEPCAVSPCSGTGAAAEPGGSGGRRDRRADGLAPGRQQRELRRGGAIDVDWVVGLHQCAPALSI